METIKITQTITQVGDGAYDVRMQYGDEDYTEAYNRSNPIFPVYRELTQALYNYEDCAIDVTTNSRPLAKEFNAIENVNATLLRNLKNTAAQQGITLTITYQKN